jgi:Tol biopolymer transport system component
MRKNTLFATPFDLSSLAVTGTPQPVLEDISMAGLGPSWNFDFSQTGTFADVKEKRELWSIFWLNSAGRVQPLLLTPGFYVGPRFSPDGKRLAFAMRTEPLRADIWVRDLDRDTRSRLTSLPEDNFPVWTPDGKNIVFESFGAVAPGMYWIRADGSGEPQRLTDGKRWQIPRSFSPDGKRLAYSQSASGGLEIWTAPIEGESNHPRV